MFTRLQQSIHSSYSISRLISRSFLLLLTLLLLVGTLAAQNEKDMPALEPGKPIERELAGDAAHSYRIALAANQFLHVIVEQKGIDVVVALFAPDGKKVAEVDSPNGTQGPEPISVLAEAAGSYRLEVRSLEAKAAAGRYQVKVEKLRAVTEQDLSLIAAQQTYAGAVQLQNQGNANSLRNAIDKYKESLSLWRTANDRAGEAKTLSNIGLIYSALGEKQKALDFYNQALPLQHAIGDRNGEAATFHNMGSAYTVLGEKQKALEFLNQALLLLRAVGNRGDEAATLNAIGVVHSALGEQRKALEFFNQALPMHRAVGNRSREATTLANIGAIYRDIGEKQKALDFYDHSLSISHAVGDRIGEATTLNNIGSVYSDLAEQGKALEFLNQALPILRAIGSRDGEARTLNNIGVIYSLLDEKQKALDFYNQALLLHRAVGDRSGEANTLMGIGSVYSALGEQQKALDFYDQALPLQRAVNNRSGEATTLYSMSVIYGRLNEHQKALEFLNQALPIHRAVSNRSGEALTLAYIAIVERNRGNLTEARVRIEEALTLFESLRTRIASQELRSSYFATVQKYYDFYIDLLMRLHQQQPSAGLDGAALQASERGRARSLLEILAEANADIRQGVDPTLVARERSLQQQLNAKAQEQTRLLNGQHTDAKAATMEKEIESLTTDLQQVEAQIKQTSPRYAALTQPQPLTLKEIQTQVLDEDTLLLEYSLGEDQSFMWAVTPTSIASFDLPKRDEIEALARQVYAQLIADKKWETKASGEQRELKRERAEARSGPEAALRLSQMLLGPVASQLGNKRLLVVADGALQYIPFAALPVPVGSGPRRPGEISGKRKSTANKYQPLVVEHEIVSLPSASTLAVLRKEVKYQQPAAKGVAILADPVFESDDERVRQAMKGSAGAPPNGPQLAKTRELPLGMSRAATESGLRGGGLRIPRLPATRDEAREILSLFPPTQSKGSFDFDASRQTATSGALSQYRYVHFATHGFLDSLHPELSGIVLSMVDEKGNPQDGFLRAHEIFNLKLPAELVVLSACQTGLGKEVKGEGLVSLTRGFMYAGAPRVVVSLWSVNDEATAELMASFYRGMLKDNQRPAAALRAAQISLMEERRWKSPFYWAAFTIQGEWR